MRTFAAAAVGCVIPFHFGMKNLYIWGAGRLESGFHINTLREASDDITTIRISSRTNGFIISRHHFS